MKCTYVIGILDVHLARFVEDLLILENLIALPKTLNALKRRMQLWIMISKRSRGNEICVEKSQQVSDVAFTRCETRIYPHLISFPPDSAKSMNNCTSQLRVVHRLEHLLLTSPSLKLRPPRRPLVPHPIMSGLHHFQYQP